MLCLLTFLLPVLLPCIYQCTVGATLYACDRNAPCGCSRVNVHLNSANIGIEFARDHSWGWAVSLRSTHGTMHFCSGVILSENYILTAAHCFNCPEVREYPLEVAFGLENDAEQSGERRIISDVYLHPEWTSQTKVNDIAILRIDRPISFTNKNYAKICLPAIDQLAVGDYPSANTSLVAIGWGYTMFDDIESGYLEQIRLIVLDEQKNQQISATFNPQLQFCAMVQGEGTDLKSGDSGAPIMYFSEDRRRWIMVGITSSGDSCGTIPQVRVYTRLSMYINWIQSIVGKQGAVFIDQYRPNFATSRTSPVNSSVMSQSRMLVSLLFPFLFFSNLARAHIYQ